MLSTPFLIFVLHHGLIIVNHSLPWANIHVLEVKRSPPIFQNLILPNLETAQKVWNKRTVCVANADGFQNASTKEHNFHTMFPEDLSSGTGPLCI